MPNKKFTLVLDSSQISTFLECPQKWYNEYIRRIVPKTLPTSNQAMDAGTYGHKLLDIYYRSRAQGHSADESFAKAIAFNPDLEYCQCGCEHNLHKVYKMTNPLAPKEIHECTRCKHCLMFRPRPFPLESEIRQQVVTTFRGYIYKWFSNDFQPVSPQHVEVGFSETVFEDENNLFVLEGRIDLIGIRQGLECVVDHKFQMQTHYLYPKSIQFKNYVMVAKKSMFFINYVRLHKQIKDTTYEQRIITFSIPEIRAWKDRLTSIYHRMKLVIEHHKERGLPRNWDSCSGYGKTFSEHEPKYCWYGALCEETDDKMVEAKEQSLYQIKEEVWRPW